MLQTEFAKLTFVAGVEQILRDINTIVVTGRQTANKMDTAA